MGSSPSRVIGIESTGLRGGKAVFGQRVRGGDSEEVCG